MEGFQNLIISAVDRVLRIVGAAALVAIAAFLAWWLL
jgi:hypothetical protein